MRTYDIKRELYRQHVLIFHRLICCLWTTTVYLFNYWQPRPPKSLLPTIYLNCAKCFIWHVLWFGTPKMSHMTLKFGLVWCFRTMHLPTKFHHPMF